MVNTLQLTFLKLHKTNVKYIIAKIVWTILCKIQTGLILDIFYFMLNHNVQRTRKIKNQSTLRNTYEGQNLHSVVNIIHSIPTSLSSMNHPLF